MAVLTVGFTLPLLFLGAGVTSHDVGMVDPRGFRPPWEIINGLLENNGLGWRLEYGHRTFGFLVGVCGILLAAGCWFFDARPAVGWFAFAALGLICAQGVLGILRVDLNARYGAGLYWRCGCFAQIVFAVLVCLAVMLSRRLGKRIVRSRYIAALAVDHPQSSFVLRQVVLGAMVRHNESWSVRAGHLLGAVCGGRGGGLAVQPDTRIRIARALSR